MGYLPSEKVAIVATIDPDAYSAGTQVSDWVNMENFHQIQAIVLAGIIAASGKIDARLVQATSSTGAGAKDVTSKSITQLTTADNDKQAVINLKAEELDIANSFTFVALYQKLTTAGGDMGAVVLGFQPRYAPADDLDLSSVDEYVS